MASLAPRRGKPLKFKSPEILQEKIDKYFHECDNRGHQGVGKDGEPIWIPDPRPYTITGLALALGCDRETLLNYGAKEDYFDTIHAAKLKIHNFAEESLWKPKIATGIVFNLSDNWNWKNQQNVKVGGDGEEPIRIQEEISLEPSSAALLARLLTQAKLEEFHRLVLEEDEESDDDPE